MTDDETWYECPCGLEYDDLCSLILHGGLRQAW